MCSSLSAQVGIRTENPQGLLHVDAKGDTNGSLNVSNDVVVTKEGRIGVGTLSPQARLHIVSSTPGAIRIADGTEGGGRILTSDANGRAYWTALVGSWYAVLKEGESIGNPSYPANTLAGWPNFTYDSYEESSSGNVNLAAGSIAVPYTASYRVTITGKGHTNRSSVNNYLIILSVKAGNTEVYVPHQHSYKAFGPLNFGFMAILSLNANQQLTIQPYRGNENANLYTDLMFHVELVR